MSPTMRKPSRITAVQTCTLVEPISMNSAASRQVAMPPIPEIGTVTCGSRAQSPTMFSAIGLSSGRRSRRARTSDGDAGSSSRRSRSTPMRLLIVLIIDTASAPPRAAAHRPCRLSVMFGVSFTITGTLAASFVQRVICSTNSGSWPTADPMPRSDIPCGQPKFSSNPSTGTVCTALIRSCHAFCVQSVINEATIARSG